METIATRVDVSVPSNGVAEARDNSIPNGLSAAAFSLSSLDQCNSRGSLLNMNLFDPNSLFKSGSFDSLLSSQLFKDAGFSLGNVNLSNANSLLAPMNSLDSKTVIHQQVHTQNSAHQLSNLKSFLPASIPSNVISTQVANPSAITHMHPHQHQYPPYGNNALIQPKENEKRIVERKDENAKFVDVTPYLTLPQHEAAKKLGIPSSTLAKRWKEASCNRKWPYRTVSKLDKEILTLLKNVENTKTELSPGVEANLGLLLKRRQEELKTVLVRL